MIKEYRFTGLSALLVLLLIFLLLFFFTLLLSPIIILLVLLLILYLLYQRFKNSISQLLRNLRKKKIKISEGSTRGELEIEFARTSRATDSLDLDPEMEDFIKYLVSKGFKYDTKSGKLYYGSKLVYALYKRTYPINNIIRLYDSKPDVDIIVLGLKGTPDNPKFIFLIPVEESRERMSIEELKRYLKKL
ncbi:hypothetical protein KKP90_03505 [Methanothermococcus sp. SCGC AD-155-E23]|nr:hypothetical protein [Methanothermococcus sp. SCGC AD-155-E23]